MWINEGRVEAKARGGSRNKRVDNEMLEKIMRIARENIKDHLLKNLPTKPIIHTSTITRHTDNQLISLKIAGKDSDVPDQRNLVTNKKIYQY